jgi:hypothetical protein
MSSFQRRDFLKGAAALAAGVTAGLVGARRAEAGDPSFMNNVPDSLLSGKDLPTFKFALEKSKGRVIGKSTAKQASVEELPISKGIAGVSMGIEPGGMRELHWHATARRGKLLSPPAIAQADGACGSWPLGPFGPLTGPLLGPMLDFSPSRVRLTNGRNGTRARGECLARLPCLVA